MDTEQASALRATDTSNVVVAEEEDDEWEYEYSTTETETFYLAVDLSYPEFKAPVARNPHHSRGGYYKHWLERRTENDQPAKVGKKTSPHARHDDAAGNDNQGARPQELPYSEPVLDEFTMNIDPSLMLETHNMQRRNNAAAEEMIEDSGDEPQDQGSRQNSAEDEEGANERNEKMAQAEEIQILDLHTSQPIFSYRGRVFEGQWAEVIGTEAILARREDNNGPDGHPPALRQLAENIDLLAASSSRIQTTERELVPKAPEEDSLADIRREWNIKVPSGKDKSGERSRQASFLEKLIALKLKKGESDRVTVFATNGEGQDFMDHRNPDYRPRRKKQFPGSRDEDGDGRRSRSRPRGRRPGRPRTRPLAKKYATFRGDSRSESFTEPLSTPTPVHWDELLRQQQQSNRAAEGASNGKDQEEENQQEEEEEDLNDVEEEGQDTANEEDSEGSGEEALPDHSESDMDVEDDEDEDEDDDDDDESRVNYDSEQEADIDEEDYEEEDETMEHG